MYLQLLEAIKRYRRHEKNNERYWESGPGGGEAASAEAVLAPHLAALYAQAMRFCGDRPAAEDLLQEVVVYALEHEKKVLSLDPVRPWLMRCLYHRFIDTTRLKKRESHRLMQVDSDECVSSAPNPEASYYHRQVMLALQALTAEQRATVTLFDIEGYSLQDIAEILEMPVGTVKSHIHRARKKLKLLLSLQPTAEIVRLQGQRAI
ncbi:RNA polymerase sigma factor [Teredinibacter haidensis]|uniref:RNA polymerase sigma factor n=1 Tax=Teredinibacter haidensis TaxID=2731755 RepID=UPI00163D0678|nr:RNA polymerase sigma factor [Teredinibacter haidensis]